MIWNKYDKIKKRGNMNLLTELKQKLTNENKTYAPNGISIEKILYESLNNTNTVYVDFFIEYGCNTEHLKEEIKDKIEEERELFPINSSVSVPKKHVKLYNKIDLQTNSLTKEVLEYFNNQEKKSDEEKYLFALFIYSLFKVEEAKEDQEFSLELLDAGFDFGALINDIESANKANSALEEMCTNLNDRAKKGLIDDVIGRKHEILTLVEILGKRKKSNTILVGPPGCGKTAIPEGLALKIVNNDVPHTMKNAVIYDLQVASIVAGTKFRGDFEEKLMNLIKELKSKKEEGKEFPILFIDEIHTIVGSGSGGGSGLDFGNILKPALADGSISVIGATTEEEFHKFINQEKALKRRFVPVTVNEPSFEETLLILKGLKKKYEDKHKVTYTIESLRRCIELSNRYIKNTAQPDKGLDLMDYTGSVLHVEKRRKVSVDDVEASTAKYLKIPLNAIKKDNQKEEEKQKLELAPLIKKDLYGQDQAVEDVVDVIELNLAGFKEKDKTMGNFLMIGPTGVGKTELAKLIAKNLELPLERIDMSEFMDAHSSSKFIGAPPGFVGFDKQGKLSKIANRSPHCVLLLDEVEKAHPKVLDILLQIMDNGEVTDSQDETLSFKDSIILMTSNAGAKQLQSNSIGLSKDKKTVQKSKSDKIVKNFFTPEFRGRLDKIVSFNSLGKEHAFMVLEKFMKEVEDSEGSIKNNVKITLDKKAKEWLIDKGYNEEYGARPLKNVIKQNITKIIAKSCLYGEIKKGKNKVKISVKDNELSFSFC
jgi:ATP-dependent Clp protease ATP-binding subunit ClpA